MLLCMLVVIAPWTVRNYQRLGHLVPVSTIGWFAAAEGNTLDHPQWLAPIGPAGFAFRRQYFSVEGEMERVEFARAWLLEPDNSIQAGTAYIASQSSKTDLDPPKVSCAYNAGGV